MNPNPSKIDEKTIPDRWKCVLGAFSAPNRAQVGSGGVRREKVTHFESNFNRTFGSKGRFWDRRKIDNRFKILFVSIDGHFDPRKMVSGRGFGKNMKNRWKTDAKIEGFWWLGTTFGVILFTYFTFSPFWKSIRNLSKWEPQSHVFWSKTISTFWCYSRNVEKTIKIDHWSTKGRNGSAPDAPGPPKRGTNHPH